MTVLVDTAVIMYAAGAEHPLRDPSRRVLSRVGTGDLDGVISVEIVQEIFHRFLSIRRADLAETQAREALDFFAPVLPITHALALMRYGMLGDPSGLRNIWGAHAATATATLSLLVVAAFAAVLAWVSVRVFARAAMR